METHEMKIFLPPALLEVTAEELRATSKVWIIFNRERAQRTQKFQTLEKVARFFPTLGTFSPDLHSFSDGGSKHWKLQTTPFEMR
jgi:hypothetical protein